MFNLKIFLPDAASQEKDGKFNSQINKINVGSRYIYAFDQNTFSHILNVHPCEPGESLKIYLFRLDPEYKDHFVRGDWIGLTGSLIKVLEVYVLRRFHSRILCWIGGCSWFYFFNCAVLLQGLKFTRRSAKTFGSRRKDVSAGKLPTARKRGEERRILQGVLQNFRDNLLWRVI